MQPTPEDFAYSRLVAYAAYQWPGYQVARHHRLIARHLEAVERGDITRLMIFMPPRAGKSMLVSEFFPAWYLGRNPSHYLIAATYAQDLADDFGRKVRNQIADTSFQSVFPGCTLKGDSQSAKRFHVTQKPIAETVTTQLDGAYFATGIGGPMSGRGSHLLLIDDPVKNREEAESATVRQRNKDWYTSTAYTRLMPGGKIVLVMTRWHTDDLAGWLLDSQGHEKWTVLNLPAIAEVEDEIDRKPGEALWPEAFPLDVLEKIRTSIGSRDWTALYQQRPAPAEGGIFKAAWFRRYAQRQETYDQIIQSWDTAIKADQINDPSCCTTWGVRPDGFDLLQVLVRRLEYPDLKRLVRSQAENFAANAVLIEDKASGQQLLQDLGRETKLPLIGILPVADKITRASAVSAMIEAGKVALPTQAAWLTDYEAEMLTFPNAVHDDQCLVAGTRIATRRGDVAIENVKAGDHVLTPDGWRKVLASGQTGIKLVIHRCGLVGTTAHPVFALDRGYVNMDTLTQDHRVMRLTCFGLLRIALLKSFISMAYNSEGWEDVASTISRNQLQMQGAEILKAYMSLFGNFIQDKKFRKAMKLIIKTATLSISSLTILSVYRLQCIVRFPRSLWTWKNNSGILPESAISRQLGIALQKVVNGIGNMLSNPFTSVVLDTPNNVKTAVQNSRLFARSQNTATMNAVQGIAGNTKINTLGSRPVFNLTIENPSCFFANGVLVHNCDSTSQMLNWFKSKTTVTPRIRVL